MDRDQLIDVLRVEGPHVLGLVGVVGPDLDLVDQLNVGELGREQLISSHIQDMNYLKKVFNKTKSYGVMSSLISKTLVNRFYDHLSRTIRVTITFI